eukprot:6457759-Amphidinium_carterae.1
MDSASFQVDPGRGVKFLLPPSTSGRRMRIDADLKRKLIEDESRKKRARSVQESAAVLEVAEGNAGNVRRWVLEYMRQYATASRRHFAHASILVVASDGKRLRRLGQPAEETTVFAACDYLGGRAAWLMPVVRQHETRKKRNKTVIEFLETGAVRTFTFRSKSCLCGAPKAE